MYINIDIYMYINISRYDTYSRNIYALPINKYIYIYRGEHPKCSYI